MAGMMKHAIAPRMGDHRRGEHSPHQAPPSAPPGGCDGPIHQGRFAHDDVVVVPQVLAAAVATSRRTPNKTTMREERVRFIC